MHYVLFVITKEYYIVLTVWCTGMLLSLLLNAEFTLQKVTRWMCF